MDNEKEGEVFNIHSYKHNSKFHRGWDDALYIGMEENYAIYGNNKTIVTECDGRTWKTKEPTIMYFIKDNWFNIIAQLKPTGIFYKCNIASPYVIEEKTIKYIDYDLDLKVFSDGSFKVLDRGEYKYHKKLMGYSDDLDEILRSELTILIERVRKKEFPFNKETVEKHYKKYKNLEKITNK